MTTLKKIARVLLLGASAVLVWIERGSAALGKLCDNGARRLEQ